MTRQAQQRGRFISLEGLEGLGKSTNIGFIRDHLVDRGIDVLLTREPGGTPLAERIRDLVIHHDGEPMPPVCELLLVFAARASHVENVIRPALRSGTWVVCDRFTDATLAYQGGGRGESRDRILALADWVHGGLWPDLTLLLDAPVALSRSRIAGRSNPDRFEREQSEFYSRVQETYRRIALGAPERVKCVDASGSLNDVQVSIARHLEALL